MTDSPSNATPWPITLLKCVVALTSVGCLLLSFVVAQNEREFLTALLGVVCLLVLSYPLFTNPKIGVFEPITFMVLLAIIGIPIKLVYVMWIRKSDPFVAEFVLLQQDPDMFLRGTTIMAIGFVIFVAGYLLKFPTPPISGIFLPRVTEWNGKRLQIALLVFASISFICFLGFIASAGVSFSSFTSMSQKRFLDFRAHGGERMHSSLYLFCRGAAFSKFVVYFCFIWLVHNKKPIFSGIGLVLGLAIVQTILLAVVLNSRAGVALLLLDCTIISYFLLRKIDARLVAVCFGIATMLMIPMLAARVKSVGKDETGVQKIVQKTICGRNMLDVAKFCHVSNGVPKKMEYRNGEMLYAWLAAPIPFSYWPDKPKWANQGLTLNQKIFDYRGSVSGCPPGLMGELYWNFGLTGTLFGLFFAGLVYRQIYASFYPHRFNPTSILIYTMIFSRFFLFSIANDLGTGIVKAGLDLVPVYATLLFIGMVCKEDVPVIAQAKTAIPARRSPQLETAQ